MSSDACLDKDAVLLQAFTQIYVSLGPNQHRLAASNAVVWQRTPFHRSGASDARSLPDNRR